MIAWHSGNTAADIEKLEKLGLTVFAAEAARLEDIPRLLRMTGNWQGRQRKRNQRPELMKRNCSRSNAVMAGVKKISVFQLIWHQPLMTVNAQSYA